MVLKCETFRVLFSYGRELIEKLSDPHVLYLSSGNSKVFIVLQKMASEYKNCENELLPIFSRDYSDIKLEKITYPQKKL